jgi:hypothetical protein
VPAICLSEQTADYREEYIHHEYLYGTARIDYVERVESRTLITYYYRYENSADPFLVTSVQVYNGSKYYAPQLLRTVRYSYDAHKRLVTRKIENGPIAAKPIMASSAFTNNQPS